jgi:putative transcriptional regulator
MKNSIKVERAKLDLTQEELANKIGVSRQTINAMEANKYVPSTVLALKLAAVFQTKVEAVFQLDEGDE